MGCVYSYINQRHRLYTLLYHRFTLLLKYRTPINYKVPLSLGQETHYVEPIILIKWSALLTLLWRVIELIVKCTMSCGALLGGNVQYNGLQSHIFRAFNLA